MLHASVDAAEVTDITREQWRTSLEIWPGTATGLARFMSTRRAFKYVLTVVQTQCHNNMLICQERSDLLPTAVAAPVCTSSSNLQIDRQPSLTIVRIPSVGWFAPDLYQVSNRH